MKFLLSSLVCSSILILGNSSTSNASPTPTSPVCPIDNSTVPIKYSPGQDVELSFNTSVQEKTTSFTGYQAIAHCIVFSAIKKNEEKSFCTNGQLNETCLNGKIIFERWNHTHLMIKIFSVTVNDSGQYAVRAMFKSPHPNDKEQKYITVLKHLHIEGNSSTPNTSPTPTSFEPNASPNSTSLTPTSSGTSHSARALQTFDNLAWMITAVTAAVVISRNPSIGLLPFTMAGNIF